MIEKIKQRLSAFGDKIKAIKLPEIKKPVLKMPALKMPALKMPALKWPNFGLRRAMLKVTGGAALGFTAVTVSTGAVIGLNSTAEAFAVSTQAKACLDAQKKNMVCAPEGIRALDIQRNTIGTMFAAISLMGVGMGGVMVFERTIRKPAPVKAPTPKPVP